MKNKSPLDLLNIWIDEEKQAGAPNPQQAVLSTATKEALPHARVVAIREISPNGMLFFTQKGTRKVREMEVNPHASLTFWFELKQREVIIEALVEKLQDNENRQYWESYPRIAQERFLAYAPTSGQPIESKQELEVKKINITKEYEGKEIPGTPLYCGYRLKPSSFSFYAYRTDELSDVCQYKLEDGAWTGQLMSP
jgi:pyridoxamine 5'-phosphate oxidase